MKESVIKPASLKYFRKSVIHPPERKQLFWFRFLSISSWNCFILKQVLHWRWKKRRGRQRSRKDYRLLSACEHLSRLHAQHLASRCRVLSVFLCVCDLEGGLMKESLWLRNIRVPRPRGSPLTSLWRTSWQGGRRLRMRRRGWRGGDGEDQLNIYQLWW